MKYWYLFAAVALLALIIYGNHHLTVSRFDLPAGTDLKIVLLSDLHWAVFGKDNCRLVALIRQQEPDVIFIAGDLLDKRIPNRPRTLRLLRQLTEICPVYYVRGNHEVRLDDRRFLDDAAATGTNCLANQRIRIGDITLIGLDDASACGSRDFEAQKAYIEKHLNSLENKEDDYVILLSHQPHHIDSYSSYNIDLVLCGHVHGGQFRLPLIGGLYGPQQGILPKYDSGMYEMNGTTMILSRGLGNSLFPFRFNNFPEIVVIDLKKNEEADSR